MKNLIPLASVFLLLLCYSCKHEAGKSSFGFSTSKESLSEMSSMDMLSEEPEHDLSKSKSKSNTSEIDEKIIKTGTMAFQVSNINEHKSLVDQLLKQKQAYYENEHFYSRSNMHSYSLMIRVPNKDFDSLVDELENGVGSIQSKNIQVNDVSEEYVDLKIRLNNSLAYLEQYKEILKKATTIKEILEVKEIIRRTEADIESKKGRIKYLDNQVTYSTLHVELREKIEGKLIGEPTFVKRIASAFKTGFNGFQSFLIVLVSIWPFILLIIFFFLLRKNIWNIVRRKKSVE